MRKIFIYYSLTGNGDMVASYLEGKHIDIRKINVLKELPKNFFLQIMVGGFKALIGYKEKIIDFDYNIDKYDEVIIGSPIWNSRLSTPIMTVLSKLNLNNKKITFILYSGSGKAIKASEFINKNYDAKTIFIKEPKKNKSELKKIEKL